MCPFQLGDSKTKLRNGKPKSISASGECGLLIEVQSKEQAEKPRVLMESLALSDNMNSSMCPKVQYTYTITMLTIWRAFDKDWKKSIV